MDNGSSSFSSSRPKSTVLPALLLLLLAPCLCWCSEALPLPEDSRVSILGHARDRSKRSDDTAPLQGALDHLSQSLNRLQAQLTALQHHVTASDARIERQEKAVAFNARLTGATSHPFTGTETLVLGAVDVNTGNGYDKHTGMFTAPTPGLYLFSLHFSHTPPGEIHVEILKNGGEIAECAASGDDNYSDRASVTVVTHLWVGDKVWVRRRDGTSHSIEASFRTSFSGILVLPDRP